jgi:hypothetical protein
LTLQCNSYLSHVRSFFKISSNLLSLISSYPLLKMFVLSCCLTPSILFNFRSKKIKTYGYFIYIFWRCPTAIVHRNESVLKNIFKRGYEEIRDRKLLEILKKDRTWLQYELHDPVRVLQKDEKILGRKHIYLPHAQTAIYDSKVTGNR